MLLDPTETRQALERLAKSKEQVFGSQIHKFKLNRVLGEDEVEWFERNYAIALPEDYRHFVTKIGNGGAGPTYGVFPLGFMDDTGAGLKRWKERNDLVGDLSEPFQFDATWNDLTGLPSNNLADADEDEYDREMKAFETRYWDGSLMNGAIPICHTGCALRVWLVVSGKQAGRLWHDGRADYSGIAPMFRADGSPHSFSSWYFDWLEESLRTLEAS